MSSEWLAELPAPVAVAYEAGPTGFGLARQLTAAGIRCVVAAPSKLQRPPGDRVKTDARDARHLANLLRMDQIVEVRVPSVEQEAARDLVRAREDVRGDLMRSRHRLSKLLLRQGIVYSGGHPWTGAHEVWLRGQRFDLRRVCSWRTTPAFETVLLTTARRDRLDKAITEMAAQQRVHPGGAPVVLPARGVHADRVRAGGGDRRLAAVHRRPRSAPTWGWCPPSPPPVRNASQGSITKTGNTHARRLLVEAAWHHRKAYRPGPDHAGPVGPGAGGRPGPRSRGQPPAASPLGGVHRPEEAAGRRERRDRPGAGRLVLVAGRHGRLTVPDRRALAGAAERRAAYGAAPPASRVAARSLRDGLRPPLTPEPLRPLPGQGHGQARGPARWGARRSAAQDFPTNPPGGAPGETKPPRR